MQNRLGGNRENNMNQEDKLINKIYIKPTKPTKKEKREEEIYNNAFNAGFKRGREEVKNEIREKLGLN